jgi:class 3 adenylate cyclase
LPIFMDRHEPPPGGVFFTRDDVFNMHGLDLSVESKHGVRFLGALIDLDQQMGFCIAEAPHAEAVQAMHSEAHGNTYSKIIEIDDDTLKAFLGVTKSLEELGHQGDPKWGVAFQPSLRTILFTDLEGSTEMNRTLGDERALAVRRRLDDIVKNALFATSGRQIKTLGDGVLACFMSVVKALECARHVQQAVSRIESTDRPLRLRVGLAAGEPVADGDDLFGLAVNLASRVCDACEPGAVFVTSTVRDLAAGKGYEWDDAGEHSFKGFDEPVRVYRLRWSA